MADAAPALSLEETLRQQRSPAMLLVDRLVAAVGKELAHKAIDAICDGIPTIELAAIAYDWRGTWARPKQIYPDTAWRRGGYLCGRGFGKTRANSEFVNEQVREGHAKLIGLAAQDEQNSIDLQVLGPDGLVATAPPWFRPRWEASSLQLVWPDDCARAIVRTPERPGKVRGWSYDLSWLIEIQSWPKATQEETMHMFRISTRLGKARIVWDATPKKKHPILVDLLKEAENDPETNIVVRGWTHENAANLGEGYVEDLDRKYGGTHKGREELGGEMLDESENPIATQAQIDTMRRPRPESFARVGLGLDPAVTKKAGSDRSGIVAAALGHDGQGYVLRDDSGKHSPAAWGELALTRYVELRADIIVVETNKGGDLCTQNLRAAAVAKGLRIVLVGKEEVTHHVPGIVYVTEVYSRGEKADRAKPLSTAYEQGRVSHVIGAELSSLETTLTTWEPTPGSRSPDDLDALVSIMCKLLGISMEETDNKKAFEGLERMREAIGNDRATLAASTVLMSSGSTEAFEDLLRSLSSPSRGGRI